jgi:hypothetical protein
MNDQEQHPGRRVNDRIAIKLMLEGYPVSPEEVDERHGMHSESSS